MHWYYWKAYIYSIYFCNRQFNTILNVWLFYNFELLQFLSNFVIKLKAIFISIKYLLVIRLHRTDRLENEVDAGKKKGLGSSPNTQFLVRFPQKFLWESLSWSWWFLKAFSNLCELFFIARLNLPYFTIFQTGEWAAP